MSSLNFVREVYEHLPQSRNSDFVHAEMQVPFPLFYSTLFNMKQRLSAMEHICAFVLQSSFSVRVAWFARTALVNGYRRIETGERQTGIGEYTPRLEHDELTRLVLNIPFLHTPVPDDVSG